VNREDETEFARTLTALLEEGRENGLQKGVRTLRAQTATFVHIVSRELLLAYAARRTVTIGRCFRPSWKWTSIVNLALGLPRTNANSLAHGELRFHLLRGSKRG
jgi:hypothetical protein